MKIILWICTVALSTGLLLPFRGVAAQTAPKQDQSQQTAGKTNSSTTHAPTQQEIATAKSQGQVWVNTSTRVYHKDGAMYGTTKHGKFMSEDDAKKAGYRAAKESGTTKKSAKS